MKANIRLERCKRSDERYQNIRDRHYVENHGCIGRQLHYLIYLDDKLVGIITGASAVWACRPRDEFFGITKENRIEIIGKIICNTVFRLEKNEPNLGTQILSLFRKTIIDDWYIKYGEHPIGFETFIFGENRFGSMYKADNWTMCGITSGSAKHKPHGAYGIGERKITETKLVFCKSIGKEE